VCINLQGREFKVAGHPIWGFFGYRIQNEATEQWVEVTPESYDLANASFKLPDPEVDPVNGWDLKASVACDFYGKKNADGTLMDRSNDIIFDLLTVYLKEDPNEIDA
jgi:hypothetical protein